MSKEACDALVIGSGMGGLAAAALLAREGRKVLVVERMPRLGGRCSTMAYRGFRCTTGVIGAEIGGTLEALFRTVGARYDVIPAGPPHYLAKGTVVEVPPRGGLRRLLSASSDRPKDVDRVMAAFSDAMKQDGPSKDLSLREWLCRSTRDDAILDLFRTMVSATLVVNEEEVSASEYFLFLKKLGGLKKFGYCPGGSIGLASALVERIRELGGEVWTEAKAEGIVAEKGMVRAGKVSKGGRDWDIRAKVVISNTGPRKTVQLVGQENMGRAYLKELLEKVRPAPILCFHIGAEEPLIEEDCLMVTGSRRINALYQPSRLCPELAPEGMHYLLAGAAPKSSLPPLDARAELEVALEDLRALIPDFDRRAEILLAGCYRGEWPGMHAWPGRDMPQRTPVFNLYNVGDGVKPPGTTGLVGAVASALAAVEDIGANAA